MAVGGPVIQRLSPDTFEWVTENNNRGDRGDRGVAVSLMIIR